MKFGALVEVGVADHQRQAQLLAAVARQRQADQAARLARHEVDVLGADDASAAMMRSPSFSRSSSSMMTTIRPCRMSARISSIVFSEFIRTVRCKCLILIDI